MNYFICGFSGAGKSFLLQELQDILKNRSQIMCSQYHFIDLDDYIFREYGLSRDGASYQNLGDYIRNVGFEQFRADEVKALETLIEKDNIILSLGGGTLNEKTMAIIKNHSCRIRGFWLATSFTDCYERIKGDQNRPLSSCDKNELRDLFLARSKFYELFPMIYNAQQLFQLLEAKNL